MPEPVVVKLGVSVYVTRQRLGKNVTAATNTQGLIELLQASFYMWSVSIKRAVCRCLCIPISLLGSGSVNTFLRKFVVGGAIFYAARVASKESGQLLLPRTSCRVFLSTAVLFILVYS
jgi:hypothetical protein